MTLEEQKANVIKIKHMKEGQIRGLRWMRQVLQNFRDRDTDVVYVEVLQRTVQNQIDREFRELETIKEDLASFS